MTQASNATDKAGRMKPWADSRGPIAASRADVMRAIAINALLTQPLAILPQQEGDPVKPFAIGLWKDINQHLNPDAARTALRRATGAFVHGKNYLYACAQPDAMRHDIDGNSVEPVSTDDRLRAQVGFLALHEKLRARRKERETNAELAMTEGMSEAAQ